ncbi:hypothetical protein K438DRAFT_1813902 [Mycena galopus ATCC 62051]|nr:hypothetical protein K438DRAFT_1813902 [Mycena galopus ATCC 62051]
MANDPDYFRLLDLPPEILTYILAFLPNAALQSTKKSSRFLFTLITSSIELQYQMAAEVAQVVDNASSRMPIYERLALLRTREEAFEIVSPSWKITVPVPFQASGLYELSGGLFWLGEEPNRTLRYLELPSQPSEEGAAPLEWKRITLPSQESYVIDFGLAVDEHDLIVMATFTPSGIAHEGLVKLEFFTVSAPHEPHPEAHGPITVQTSKTGKPNVLIEIVGDHLVLEVGYPYALGRARPQDMLYVYEWKTGKQKWNKSAECRTYMGAVFLSPEIIMLPNTAAARLELWSVASDQEAPILILHLPRLVPGFSIFSMTSRSEPNPQASYRRPRRMPFHSSAEDAIVLIHLMFSELGLRAQHFMLFVHRRALLALLAAHSPGDSCDYADWGPDVCRWFNTGRLVMDWITLTSGQRCVLVRQPAPTAFIILDFNLTPTTTMRQAIPPEDDPFEDSGIWAEPVGSRLPCCFAVSSENFDISGASLDDHRVIAVRRNITRRVQEVDIHYFG